MTNLIQVGLEREQEKLLTVNVELALETKRLLEQQKEWEEQEKVSRIFVSKTKKRQRQRQRGYLSSRRSGRSRGR